MSLCRYVLRQEQAESQHYFGPRERSFAMTQENDAHSGANQSSPLSKAIHDLEQAEAHLRHARADESAAEREVSEALKEIKEAEHGKDLVTVHVVHVNETEKASFKEPIT